MTAQHVWSPFYVDDMIETDTNPDVSSSQSNGGVNTSFATDATTHTTPSGSADSTFGTSGVDIASTNIIWTPHPGFSPVATNAGGQLFLGNTDTPVGSSPTTFTVYEYNRDGSVDSSFGSSGAASETVSGERTGVILQMLTDGQIVIGAAGGNFVLVRFNANGSLDTTFGTSGGN